MTSSLLVLVVVSQVFLHVDSHTHGKDGNCEFNGHWYKEGAMLTEAEVCAPMRCFGYYGTGWMWSEKINPKCKKCIVYCDPHIITFDSDINTMNKYSYAYQGCGNYSMTQPILPRDTHGDSPYNPDYAVYSTFKHCGRDAKHGVSCLASVTFKEDDIMIKAESENGKMRVDVKVNGDAYTVHQSAAPVFVPPGWSGGNDKVMAWRDNTFDNPFKWEFPESECVFFQGTKGLLVQFCGNKFANTLYIWAMRNLKDNVNGLCGTFTDDIKDEYTTRNGFSHEPPLKNPDLNIWAESWLTTKDAVTSCPKTDNKTICIGFDTHHANCMDTIVSLGSGLTDYEIEAFTDDCTFDLCHVDNPTGYLHSAVASFVNITTYIKSITISEEVATPLTDSAGDRIVVQVLQKVN